MEAEVEDCGLHTLKISSAGHQASSSHLHWVLSWSHLQNKWQLLVEKEVHHHDLMEHFIQRKYRRLDQLPFREISSKGYCRLFSFFFLQDHRVSLHLSSTGRAFLMSDNGTGEL